MADIFKPALDLDGKVKKMTIFSKIIRGEIPCHRVAENEDFLAFLDISPLAMGHVLVIPKVEESYIFNLPDTQLADLHVFAKKVALATEKVIPCQRMGMAVIGLEVPHVHIHLIPLQSVQDINFSREKLQPNAEELAHTASLIHSSFQKLYGHS